jgi:hypothetical protein
LSWGCLWKIKLIFPKRTTKFWFFITINFVKKWVFYIFCVCPTGALRGPSQSFFPRKRYCEPRVRGATNRGVHDSFLQEAISSCARNRSTAADLKFRAKI